MEGESGFMELIRRVGEERAANNRFGKGFDHQVPPNREQMTALATNSVAAFEGSIYDLFRQSDCLKRSNNDKLFTLLCRVRSLVQPRLSDLLAAISESIPGGEDRSLLLGGCYFAATGNGKSRQGFIKSVLTKLVELQDEVQWKPGDVERGVPLPNDFKWSFWR